MLGRADPRRTFDNHTRHHNEHSIDEKLVRRDYRTYKDFFKDFF